MYVSESQEAPTQVVKSSTVPVVNGSSPVSVSVVAFAEQSSINVSAAPELHLLLEHRHSSLYTESPEQ